MRFLHMTKKLLLVVMVPLFIGACNDFNGPEPVETGDVNFSNYVAVGNSITAGFQSSALYESAQQFAFPNLLANQIGIENFEQPLIGDPGIGGRIGLVGLPSQLSAVPQNQWGQPTNSGLSRPFNNLGIPGALLADFLGQDLGPANTYAARQASNPFYGIVLRNQGNTQAAQMAALNPSFITFWLGNNDILGYVTSGGHTPFVPANVFTQLYTASTGQLAQTGATVVNFNIPNVTSIPFVFLVNTTLIQDGTLAVNPQTGIISLAQLGAPIWIERTDPNQPGVIQDTVRMSAPIPQAQFPGDFFLLSARSQLPTLFAQGVGLSKQNPIQSELVLDSGELTQAATQVAQYNQTISTLSSANGFLTVDVNSSFSDIVNNFRATGGQGGITSFGVTLRPVPGELFSFDGVHPSNRGQAVIANDVIRVLNNSAGAQISLIDIKAIPEGLPVNAGL